MIALQKTLRHLWILSSDPIRDIYDGCFDDQVGFFKGGQ